MSKIEFPNKGVGDQFSASEANEIKSSVNSLYDNVETISDNVDIISDNVDIISDDVQDLINSKPITTTTETNLTGLLYGNGVSVVSVDVGNGLSLASNTLSNDGILGSAGSTDNAVLRADGTGGATLQTSNLTIDDLYTASPNNVVNYVCAKVEGGATNVGLALVPKGTGAFSLAVPNGLASGGNARGANAIDLQTDRGAAADVASGQAAFVAGRHNRATGFTSIAIGNASISSSDSSFAAGQQCQATGVYSAAIGLLSISSGVTAFAIGSNCTASGARSAAMGLQSLATLHGQRSFSAGQFAAQGDAQDVHFVLRNRTTNATPTTLFLDGSSFRLVISAGKVFAFTARITGIRSDGVSVAEYVRKGVIKRIVNTTSLVGTIEIIGTDIEDNAATDVEITADDTNEALQVNVTGIAGETWRWVAVVEGVEIAFGT